MLRRILAFILGMIFGMVLLVGGLVGGVYYVATSVPPAQLAPETQIYLGDLANMPIMDMATTLQKLYTEKLGLMDENGQYYSLGDFCAQYHIDTNAAFGIELPQEVLDIPLFEFFNEATDAEGQTGVQRAMKQIKVSAVPSIVNLFATPDEQGNPVVNQSVVDELSNYSLDDLMSESRGLPYVFQNIMLADLVPSAFPAEDSNNAIMWALGQSMLGGLIGAFSSSDSLYTQFAEGGALGALGALKVTDLLGGGDDLLQSLLGDTLLRQMINEEGSVSFEGLLASLYLGNILCYKRSAVTDTSAYTTVLADNSVMQNGNNYIRVDANGKYWTATFSCTEDHIHTASCYKYNWYSDVECTIPVDGIYSSLVNIAVSDLMSGSTDAIMNEIMNLRIKDIVNGELTGILASFADLSIGELMGGGIDGMYIGGFLGFTRTTANAPASYATLYKNGTVVSYVGEVDGICVMSDNGTDWYVAHPNCSEDHTHDSRTCYSYNWLNGSALAEGVMALFADKKVSDLANIENELMKLTLRDVLGDEQLQSGILKELADVEIGQLTTTINTLYIGSVMGFIRNEVDAADYTATSIDGVLANGTSYAKRDSGKWYAAELACTETEADHIHTAKCYEFAWYEAPVVSNSSNYADTDLVLDDGHHARVGGLYAALVNITIADLTSGSADVLLNKIKNIKIRDIVNGEITGILASFADMTVNDLMNGGIDGMYIGSFLSFTRIDAATPATSTALTKGDKIVAYVANNGELYIMSDNGTDWYNAKLICSEEHDHNSRSCFSYVWMDGENQPEGVMAIFADKKVNELNNIEDDLMKLTLREVLGDDKLQSGILKDLADVEIGQLTNVIDTLYIGSIMGFIRNEVDVTDYASTTIETILANGNSYAKRDDNKWYAAELTCNVTDGEHSHTAACYEFAWYEASVTTDSSAYADSDLVLDDGHHARVSGLYAVLVNLTIADLTNGSADTLLEKIKDLKIRDIVNGEITGVLASFADMTVNELMNGGIDGMYVGSFLNYTRTSAEAPASNFAVYKNSEISAYIGLNDTQYVMSDDGAEWYNAKLTCNEEHAHNNRTCYSYAWLNGDAEPENIMAIVADKKVNELGDIKDDLMKLTLRDVLGDEQLQSGLLKDLADVEIGQLTDVIDTLYIGSIMGFIRNEVSTDGYTAAVEGVWQKTDGVDTLYVREHDGKTYEAELTCIEEHEHNANCYNFVWYQANVTENSEDYADTDLVLDDGHHARVEGLYTAMVNLTIADLTNGSSDKILESIRDLKISDIVTGEIHGILASFADLTVNEMLNGAIDDIYAGSFLNYTRTNAEAPDSYFAVYMNGEIEAYVGMNGSQYVMSEKGTEWFEAKLVCKETHSHDNRSCFAYVWAFDGIEADRLMTMVADKKVDNLDSIRHGIMELTLLDVLGEEQLQSGLLKELANVEIGQISTQINQLYLGSILGAIRGQSTTEGYDDCCENVMSKVSGESTSYIRLADGKWYFAELGCTTAHSHTESCYNFIWYNADVLEVGHEHSNTEYIDEDGHHARVEGINAALVNLTVQDLTSGSSEKILNCIKDLKIRDIVSGEISGVMANFADMTVNELVNGGIDDLYLGNFLSYARTTSTAPATSTQLTDGEKVVGYVGIVDGQIVMSDDAIDWYVAKAVCEQSHEHNRNCYSYIWMNGENPATGVMGKLADKKISQLDNLSDTVSNLTLREVLGDDGVQSGLLSELADVSINEITNRINGLHLGSVFGDIRNEITDITGFVKVEGTEDIWTNSTIFAKSFEGVYCEAELACAETHAHTDECYGYIWYKAEVLEESHEHNATELVLEDGHHARATGIQAALSNIVISELMSGSTDTILKSIEHMTLDELTNGGIVGIMANFSDMTMYDLIHSGIDNLYLGGFMRFDRQENAEPSISTELFVGENVVAYVGTVNGQIVMSDNGTVWYNAKLVCEKEHTHGRSCYSYIWYDGGELATGLMATLADKKMSEVNNISNIVQGLTLRDVLEDNQLEGGLLSQLADIPLSEISTKINTLYLGSVMNGIRNQIDDVDGYTAVVGTEGVFTNGTIVAKIDGENYYQAARTCTTEHAHDENCYEFVWYSATVLAGDHEHSADELVLEDGHHAPLTGINKALANLILDDLTGSSDVLFNKIKTLTVSELAGGEISGVMENLADMSIDQLMHGGVETMYFGTFMHYYRLEVAGTATDVSALTLDGEISARIGTINSTLVMTDVDDNNIWYKAKFICKDAEHSHDRNCYIYLWNDEDDVLSKGMMEKLANKKVGSLQDMSESISSFTVEEVLGGNLVGVLKSLKDVPLKDLNEEIDHLYLGSVLEYYRKAVDVTSYTAVGALTKVKTNGTQFAKTEDGLDWYVAELDCVTEHDHDSSCYGYIWYTDESCTTPVSGVQKAFVNGTLTDIGGTMDNLTLGKLGIGGNNILDSMQNVPLADIGNEINNLELGVVFGFVKQGTVWYQPCEDNCGHSATEHTTLIGETGYFTEAKGLNGKMAGKTMQDLSTGNGLTDIVVALTMGELIDSGMMSLGDDAATIADNEYKFAIIFCEDTGTFSESIPIVGTRTYGCNLQDYLIYRSTHSGETSEHYFNRFSHSAGCKDSWKSLTLVEFVEELLSAISG